MDCDTFVSGGDNGDDEDDAEVASASLGNNPLSWDNAAVNGG